MNSGTPPDSYWEPPEPSIADVMEEAQFEVDQLVEEWATLARVDVGLTVTVNKYATDVVFELEYVESNGVNHEIGQEFDTLQDARTYLEKSWPIPDEYPDEMKGEQ